MTGIIFDNPGELSPKQKGKDKLLKDFKHDKNKHSSLFYRCFNEFPTLLLIVIVILAEVQPG